MNTRTPSDNETQSGSFSTSITEYEQHLFKPVESELRSSFRSLNADSIISFMMMCAESQYISSSLLSSVLSQFMTDEQREEIWKELLLPFYILPKEGLLNSMISYKYYVNFNLRFLFMKEMKVFTYETLYKDEHEEKLKLSPVYNLTSYGSDLRLDMLSVVVLLLFYAEIDNERKAEILFKLLDGDYHGKIQSGKKKVYLVIRMMILTALYLPDMMLNWKINEIPLDEKNKSDEDEQVNGNKSGKNNNTNTNNNEQLEHKQTLSNVNDRTLLKYFRELIGDYKKILLYCKHKNGFMKNFVVFVFNSVVFTKSNVKEMDLQEFKKECKQNKYKVFNPSTYRELLQNYLVNNVNETKNYLSNFPTVVKQLSNTVIANQEEYHLIVERVVNVYNEYKDCEALFKGNYPIIKDLLDHTVAQHKNQIHEFHKTTKKKKKKRNKRELDQFMTFDKHEDEEEEETKPEEKKEIVVGSDERGSGFRFMSSNVDNGNELLESINKDRRNYEHNLSTLNNVDDNENEHEQEHFSENQDIMPHYPDDANNNHENSSDDVIHNDDNNDNNVNEVNDDDHLIFNVNSPSREQHFQHYSKANNSNDLDDDLLNCQPNVNESKPLFRFTDNERFSESTNQIFNINPIQSHTTKDDLHNTNNNFNVESGFFKSIDKQQPHQLEHAPFFKEYFSQMETYHTINEDALIQRIASLNQDNIREISFDNLTPFLSGYSPKKLNSIYKGDTINELMINLYFNLMTRYNEYLRNEGVTAVKAVFFDTNFFTDLQRAIEDDNVYNELLDKYKDSLYISDKLIFDNDEYIVVVPVYVNEKYLFLAMIENAENTITFLDSNDQLSDHSEMVGNYERIFLRLFTHLNGEGLCEKDLSSFKCVNDSIEALCYDNSIAKQIMLYYAKQICKKGQIETVNDDEYQNVKRTIYAELSMFYLKLNDFISQ